MKLFVAFFLTACLADESKLPPRFFAKPIGSSDCKLSYGTEIEKSRDASSRETIQFLKRLGQSDYEKKWDVAGAIRKKLYDSGSLSRGPGAKLLDRARACGAGENPKWDEHQSLLVDLTVAEMDGLNVRAPTIPCTGFAEAADVLAGVKTMPAKNLPANSVVAPK